MALKEYGGGWVSKLRHWVYHTAGIGAQRLGWVEGMNQFKHDVYFFKNAAATVEKCNARKNAVKAGVTVQKI